MMYDIYMTTEYEEWFEEQSDKHKIQISKRVSKIEEHGHFGRVKHLNNNIYELKWDGGRRIYYSIIPTKNVLLLLGGNKNGQDKDIKKAEKIYHEWVS